MKKQVKIIATLALALVSFAGFSQEVKIQPCNTYEAMERHFAEDPEAKRNYDALQEQYKSELMGSEKSPAARTASAFQYTIPVVFHVLYDCNDENLGVTDADFVAAIQQINSDYAKQGSDTSLITQPFRSSYIPSDIKFMLAKKDPLGNCISGVVRHYDSKTNWQQSLANSGSASYWTYTWDPTKYLNVYIVASIVPQGTVTGGGIIVGYTFRPGTWSTGNGHDAIVYNVNFVNGTNNGIPNIRSLSHEMGHWLNLAHTFGNTNNPGTQCADDGITDTPITKGEFGNCPSSTIATCTQTLPAMNGLNNVQNIMNYSGCPRNFTTGQTNAMRTTLGSTMNISGRNNVYSPANLAFTDVNGAGSCAPVADFISTNCSYTVCAGGSLTFMDLSYNATPTSYNWAANNGAVLSTTNSTLTTITFQNLGTSTVSYTVSNAQGSSMKTVGVTVLDGTPGIIGPYSESFENPGVPANWTLINVDNDAVTWQQTDSASYDQSYSFMIAGAQDPPNSVDMLQMPSMDILHNQNNIFQFAYAYRQQTTTQNDVLKIEGSTDCGGTWSSIYSMSAAYMANGSGGTSTDNFVPASNEWKVYTISSASNWQNYKSSSNVLVRFNFTEGSNGYGNNIYIDAINFSSPTGINELTKSIQFNLYPNPTTSETNVSFKLDDPATIKVTVLDVTGREVLPAVENKYSAGEQTISINKNNTLAKGVYFVNLSFNGAKMSSKLVIN
jgi:hypothetical protein